MTFCTLEYETDNVSNPRISIAVVSFNEHKTFSSATVHIKINISSDVSFCKMNLAELLVLQQFYLTDNDKELDVPR